MLDDIRAVLHASQRDDPLLPPLAQRLAAFVGARVNRDRFEAWIRLLDWTREGAMRFTRRDAGAQLASSDTGRLRLLLHVLEACDVARERVQAAVAAMCANTDAASLLAEAGMPSDHGFLGEATSCMLSRVLPEPRDTQDLRQFFRRCYRNGDQVARFERWPPDLFYRLVEAIMPPADSPTWATLRQSLVDAVHLLCVRMNSQGLSPRLRSRWTAAAKPVIESPFFRLGRAADYLLAAGSPRRRR